MLETWKLGPQAVQLPWGPRRGFRAWVSLPPQPVAQTHLPLPQSTCQGLSEGARGLLRHPFPSPLPAGVGCLLPRAGGGEVL